MQQRKLVVAENTQILVELAHAISPDGSKNIPTCSACRWPAAALPKVCI